MREEPKVTEHPSFGMASFNRISGQTYLVGSEFTHQHFMSLTISRAKHARELARDWWFAQEELIEIWMSEAQFCEMISRPNIGGGVNVTLRRVNGKPVPKPPAPDMRERFTADMEKNAKECVASLQSAMKELSQAIDSGKIGKTALRGVLDKLQTAASSIDVGIPWVAEQFAESMESIVGQAKTEIEAHVSQTAMRIGIDQMRAQAIAEAPGLMIEDHK